MSIFFSVMNQNMGTIFLKMNFGKNPGIMKIQLEREYFMLEKETAKMCNNNEEGEYGWKLYIT